ncbi:MAG TPA: hypothetical protein VHD32_14230 [Candidatus Didemnitutus sp.]|nr:hypothetical protein [Candidatus Didemnitutus sp.]
MQPVLFIDRHPERGDWIKMDVEPPHLTFVEVLLPDGRAQAAVFTGERWWSTGRELRPIAWRHYLETSWI